MTGKILGMDRLRRKLAMLPLRAKAAIQSAMEDGADEIVTMMKTLVPVDKSGGGTLRDSIGWTWGSAPKGSISVGQIRSSSGNLTITIFAGNEDAFYARWVEFGTAPHNTAKGGGTKAGQKQLSIGGGNSHPGTSAQPFFFVSYRAMRRRVRGRITRAINKAAKQVAASGGS